MEELVGGLGPFLELVGQEEAFLPAAALLLPEALLLLVVYQPRVDQPAELMAELEVLQAELFLE